eukprot:CAMPEP_0119467684 /NCGR_PEP_ID=MMETSP1344-20130328/1755_1 /TAXON_ID=236787 /ORGANISM="Florenciella parvula, Strain CCMP2471" /LENGTH=89 /DNA_ID=CAMNT_0007500071 /DNA_START=432 /DNA_END=698 /DNA_ORIENTATION=+
MAQQGSKASLSRRGHTSTPSARTITIATAAASSTTRDVQYDSRYHRATEPPVLSTSPVPPCGTMWARGCAIRLALPPRDVNLPCCRQAP